jgi:hypothetical protein
MADQGKFGLYGIDPLISVCCMGSQKWMRIWRSNIEKGFTTSLQHIGVSRSQVGHMISVSESRQDFQNSLMSTAKIQGVRRQNTKQNS